MIHPARSDSSVESCGRTHEPNQAGSTQRGLEAWKRPDNAKNSNAEAVAAATRATRLRVVEDKSLPVQTVAKIKHGARKVEQTFGIDIEPDSRGLHHLIVVIRLFIKTENVGES